MTRLRSAAYVVSGMASLRLPDVVRISLIVPISDIWPTFLYAENKNYLLDRSCHIP